MNKTAIKYILALVVFGVNNATAQDYGFPDSFVNDSIGFGKSRAISVIEGERLLNTSSINPANALYGMLPGLTVQQNGGFISSPTMIIRGNSTMGDNNILILVDGIERDLSTLSIEEIESVAVLKDAASQALYGMKGSNGVLLVTTKRGADRKKSISVNYNYSLGRPTALPSFVDAATYAKAFNEGLTNDGLKPIYSQRELDAYASGEYPDYFPNVNWMKETLRDWTHSHQATITASGGDSKVKYFSLIKYVNDQGLVKNYNTNPEYSTQLMRSDLSVRTNLDVNITNTTTAYINLLAKFIENNRPGSVTDGNIMSTLYSLPSNAYPVKTSEGIWGGASGYPKNPVAETSNTGYANAHSRTIYADFTLNQKLDFLTNGLSAYLKASFDAFAENWDSRTKMYLYESNSARFNVVGDISNIVSTQYDKDEEELGFSSYLGAQKRGSSLQGGFNYRRQKGDFNVNSSLFYRQDKIVGLWSGSTFAHQDIVAYSDLAYKDKYFLGLTMSLSGTSQLPKNKRWGFFPAVSASWRIDKEKFLSSNKFINMLNFRTSYGIVGNDKVPLYLDKYPFGGSGSFAFTENIQSQGGMAEQRLPSSNYTYSKTGKFNAGMDLRMLGLVSLTVDAFYEHTWDIMVNDTYNSSIVGAYLAQVAEGKMINYGIDISMNIDKTIGDFQFNIGGNLSFVRNKIVNMNESYKPYEYLKNTGLSLGQPFGLEVIGFFKDQEDIDSSPTQYFSEVHPGDYKYKDQNGDKKIDDYDVVPIGKNSYNPEVYYSATLDLKYKNFGFSMLWQGLTNYSVSLNTTGVFKPMVNSTALSSYYLENCWRPSGVTSAIFPRLTTRDNPNNYRNNNVLITDGSYIKLRNVQVSYSLPKIMVQKMKMQSMQVFLRATDLLSFDKIKVLDPEVLDAEYPAISTIQAGLNFIF